MSYDEQVTSVVPGTRFICLWLKPSWDDDIETMDDVITAGEGIAEYFKTLKRDGVQVDPERDPAYVTLYTYDPLIAKKYRFTQLDPDPEQAYITPEIWTAQEALAAAGSSHEELHRSLLLALEEDEFGVDEWDPEASAE